MSRRRRAGWACLLLLHAGVSPARGGHHAEARAQVHAGIDGGGRLVVATAPGPGLTRFDPARPVMSLRNAHAGAAGRAQHGRCAQRWGALIREAIANTAVAPGLVLAVMEAESACDPLAQSSSGAIGLMQVMPATGTRFGADNLFDPTQNLQAAVRYLAWLHQRFDGDTRLVLAAYNAGEGAVQRYGGHVPPFAETRAYVAAVMQRCRVLQVQVQVQDGACGKACGWKQW